MKTCEACGLKIPAGRVKALPHTRRCVRCSDEKAKTVDEIPVALADDGDVKGSASAVEE
ncbi:MAG TPA: TraR/DksA C4-type zinc finger protein [Tepidisphaeraceae bacterium]|nr:TraR/DksA C4-type zinc finger protein [Tepidisphaeraceae bacterium]